MSDYWRGKGVIVTGASAGLGLAISEAFVAAGANVVMAARGREQLEFAAKKISSAGPGEIRTVVTDVTVEEDVENLISEAHDQFMIDALINNAGKSARGAILSTTPEDFQQLLDINLMSTVRCTRAAAPYLLESKGHLVNIGSLAGKSAARWLGAYSVAKFAVTAYTQQVRLEHESEGLHVMLVCPGPIARDETRTRDTDRLENVPEAAAKPGGGVKTKAIDPAWLAQQILRGCERRSGDLIYPRAARLLFAASQLSSKLGDRLVRWMT
jgi:short-subunit dehydrogenase